MTTEPNPVDVAQRLAGILRDLNTLDGGYALQRTGTPYQNTAQALTGVLALILGGGPVGRQRASRVHDVLLESGYESVEDSLAYEQRQRDAVTFLCQCGDVEHPLWSDADESVWCECGLRIAPQRELAQVLS